MDTKGMLLIGAGAAIVGLYLISKSGVLGQTPPGGQSEVTIRPSDNPGICTRYWVEGDHGYAQDFPCGT